MMIPFCKAHGTGNDTIIFLREKCPKIIEDAKFIKRICKRRTGIGADCVIIVSKHEKYDFKMDYYNSDGSWETFCANGARCVVKFLYNKKIISNKIIFLAGDGLHTAIIKNDNISIKMKKPKIIKEKLTVLGKEGYLIDSGAKHFTIQVSNFNYTDVENIGKKIRFSKCFEPEGVNVNFFEIIDKRNIKVWTYEKGIEKLMLSCGSGSVASVYNAYLIETIDFSINCKVLGGELNVKYDKSWDNVWLSGSATLLFESKINY